MKALGIVRKIDELGRVVIPKEVRKTQGWGTGQPLDMFMEGDKFVMQAYGEGEKRNKIADKLMKLQNVDPDENEAIDEAIAYLRGE